MVSLIKKRPVVLLAIAILLTVAVLLIVCPRPQRPVLGGVIHAYRHPPDETRAVSAQDTAPTDERMLRPFTRHPMENPYRFSDFENRPTHVFDAPDQALLGFFGTLRNASNMLCYTGGCGTVGDARLPYPVAYNMLSPAAKKNMSEKAFTDSFRGFGHVELLQLLPAYTPPGTPDDLAYYLAELEIITGEKMPRDPRLVLGGSHFAYAYALATVRNVPGQGWKIEKLDYWPEDFLCAPYHGWNYDAQSIMDIVFSYNLKLIETVDSVHRNDLQTEVLASGHGNRYRFVFTRLANGYDLLLHQYQWHDGAWQAQNFLTEGWGNLMFSPEFVP